MHIHQFADIVSPDATTQLKRSMHEETERHVLSSRQMYDGLFTEIDHCQKQHILGSQYQSHESGTLQEARAFSSVQSRHPDQMRVTNTRSSVFLFACFWCYCFLVVVILFCLFYAVGGVKPTYIRFDFFSICCMRFSNACSDVNFENSIQ